MPTPRFAPGQVVMTPGAWALLDNSATLVQALLHRHLRGDWGELCAEDKQQNEDALRNGGRLLSSYPLGSGGKVWIITERDRSATTLLLPDEY